jgi:hypothetical protein
MVRKVQPVSGTLDRRHGCVFQSAGNVVRNAGKLAVEGGIRFRMQSSSNVLTKHRTPGFGDLKQFGGTIMQRTLIAVFDSRGAAQSAIEELVSSGFSRQQIRLSEGDPTGAASAITGAPGTDTTTGAGTIVDSIRNFLSNMFGTDNSEHVQKYSDAVTRGHHVLTLTAVDQPEVERAADIVERYGPVDIDEKAAEWGGGALAGEAMRMGAGAQQQSASMSQQSMQGGQGSMQGSVAGAPQGAAQQGSQQRAAGTEGGTSIPVTQRSGVKVFEHLAEPALDASDEAADADESYFRSHYNSNYAGAGEQYDDYAPAYKYGSNMSADEQYRGRPWKDVEPALRSEWEGLNPGWAWSKFKAAVRHGWERITS